MALCETKPGLGLVFAASTIILQFSLQPAAVKSWLEVAIAFVTLAGLVLGGLWAYTKYVLERGYLPPVEFTVGCNVVGQQDGKVIVEVLLWLKNLGNCTLVATNIRTRVRYIDRDDVAVNMFNNPLEHTFAHTEFPHSLAKSITVLKPDTISTIPVVHYDTFVQPGVDQTYSLVTALPQTATFALVQAEFQYAQKPSRTQRFIFRLSRRLGLVTYSLDHVSQPHTAERAFRLT